MHRNIILSILLVLFVFASAVCWGYPAEGDIAPDVTYIDLDTAEDRTLYEQYEGHVVVLELFATW